jgi:CHAP domain
MCVTQECKDIVPRRAAVANLNPQSPLPITREMSIESTLLRVSAIRQALSDPATMIGQGSLASGGTEAPSTTATIGGGGTSFASALQQASAAPATATLGDLSTSAMAATGLARGAAGSGYTYPLASLEGVAGSAGLVSSTGGSPGGQIVAIAESQLGQTEQPPGSNESPAIAQYRTATAGAMPGEPWCAYFASWVAKQAGEPIGEAGQGLGSVSAIWSWAQSTGRAVVNGPGVAPKPGDLIVFGGEHVGIVRDVLPSGQIQTIEGNYESKVAANVRSPTEATGYVSMS